MGKSVHVCLWRGRECMPLRRGNLEADLLARDLTVNALALDARGILHAHPQALADLRAGLLRRLRSRRLRMIRPGFSAWRVSQPNGRTGRLTPKPMP